MLHRDDGSRLGLTEERMVAYDALVLGPHHQTLTTDTQTLIDMAQILEDMNRLQPALNLYSRAAAQGQPQAIQAITEFGVNVEWLLLGMSASRDESMIPLAPSNVVGILIERGSTHTISVFIERSHARNHVDLSVALGAIATMLASSNLPPRARRSARRSLERVASSSLEPLQDFAASSLASVDW